MENQANQSTSISTEKPQSQNPYDKLDHIYQAAIDMKLSYYPYKYIVDGIKATFHKEFKEQTIATWFMKGGKCQEAYEYKKNELLEEKKQNEIDIQEALKQGAGDAVNILRMAMMGMTITEQQIQVAEKWLNRAGYPTVNKSEGKLEVSGLQEMANAVKGVLEPKTK